jgi:hypothetical protein
MNLVPLRSNQSTSCKPHVFTYMRNDYSAEQSAW